MTQLVPAHFTNAVIQNPELLAMIDESGIEGLYQEGIETTKQFKSEHNKRVVACLDRIEAIVKGEEEGNLNDYYSQLEGLQAAEVADPIVKLLWADVPYSEPKRSGRGSGEHGDPDRRVTNGKDKTKVYKNELGQVVIENIMKTSPVKGKTFQFEATDWRTRFDGRFDNQDLMVAHLTSEIGLDSEYADLPSRPYSERGALRGVATKVRDAIAKN